MKWFDIVHNTDEWYAARAGLATTSCFNKIITPSTGEPSKQAEGYADHIIAELMLGRSIERNFDTYALQWGREHEAEAAALYCFDTGHDVKHGGFFTNDDLTLGTSPDVIVLQGDSQIGIAEIKCPENPAVHVDFLLKKKMNPAYMPQVQGQLLVTGFDWCDWFSYYPGMPSNRIRTYRDNKFIAKLETAIDEFHTILDRKLRELQMLGHLEEIPAKLMPKQRQTPKRDDFQPETIMAG